MARQKLTDQTVLDSVLGLAGDGYCRVADLLRRLPSATHRDRRRAVQRSVNHGLIIERRGPVGRMHVVLSSEGWRLLRSEDSGQRLG